MSTSGYQYALQTTKGTATTPLQISGNRELPADSATVTIRLCAPPEHNTNRSNDLPLEGDTNINTLTARADPRIFILAAEQAAASQMQANTTLSERRTMASLAVLEHVNYPIMIVDSEREILFKNFAAQNLFYSSSPLIDGAGRLRVANRILDVKLTELLQPLPVFGKLQIAGCESPNGSTKQVLVLKGAAGQGLVLHFTRIQPDHSNRAVGDLEFTLITAFQIKARPQIDPSVIQIVFSMTPAEARVASAVASGRCPEQIAEANGVAVSTVRSQIRQVLAKTDVRGQLELAALLAGNPLFSGGVAAR